MRYAIRWPLLLSVVLVMLLAACSDGAPSQEVDEPTTTSQPAVEPTATPEATTTPGPTSTLVPTATIEPASESEPEGTALPAVQTMEAILAPPDFVLAELESYEVEATGLTFDYPAGWVVTESPDGTIQIESEAGYGDRFATDAGAVIVLLPMAADDLAGQDSLEKLASFIVSSGTSPSAILGDPVTTIANDQELTFSPFFDQEIGLEGIYAAYLAGDELAVIFAVAGGANRTSYRPAVEEVIYSVILPQAE